MWLHLLTGNRHITSDLLRVSVHLLPEDASAQMIVQPGAGSSRREMCGVPS